MYKSDKRLIARIYRERLKHNKNKIQNWAKTSIEIALKQMANKQRKQSTSPLIIREMQSKSKSYHLTPVRMVTIKNRENKKCWQKCRETGNLMIAGGIIKKKKMAQTLWKTLWQLLKKFEIELPYNPAMPYLGIYLKQLKTRS